MKLNKQQQQAVTTIDTPCLVLAGAGSGKTRVIINKIAYLIEHCNYSPNKIAAVTFTNKAAREMKERVAHSIGVKQSKGLTVCTFHTLGFDFVKKEHQALSFKPSITLFDEHDQLALLKELTQISFQEDKDKLNQFINYISLCKNNLILPNDALKLAKNKIEHLFASYYQQYMAQMQALNAVDFDDLIMLPTLVLRNNDAIREKWQKKFSIYWLMSIRIPILVNMS